MMTWKLLKSTAFQNLLLLIELVDLIMTEDELEVPTNADEGLVLYRHLKSLLE